MQLGPERSMANEEMHYVMGRPDKLDLSRSLTFGKNSCVCRPVLAVSHLVCHFSNRCESTMFLATKLASGSLRMSALRRCSTRRVGSLRFTCIRGFAVRGTDQLSRTPATTGRHAVDVVACASCPC